MGRKNCKVFPSKEDPRDNIHREKPQEDGEGEMFATGPGAHLEKPSVGTSTLPAGMRRKSETAVDLYPEVPINRYPGERAI